MSSSGKIATLIDPRRKVLAIYIKRTTFWKRTASLAEAIADLKSKVDSCIKDFIVVYDEDEIVVVVDVNELRKDQIAFATLEREVRLLLGRNGSTYQEVGYPKDELYDPRKIYDSPNYNKFKVEKKRRPGILR